MATTFRVVLTELANAFTSAQRPNGDAFYKLKDDVPEWLRGSELMHAIHAAVDGGSPRLPDDWIYEATQAAADAMRDHGVENEDDARDASHEIADSLVDVYNSARSKWMASHLANASLVDEACAELGCADDASIFDRIGLGQFLAYSRILEAVITAVTDEAEYRDKRALDEDVPCPT
jgi:hypothetical protein